ncbi:cadherin-like domain-containing protein [Vibrio chagasii]|nr:cadherin-like domain-containing protein [Vibrio chagasii]
MTLLLLTHCLFMGRTVTANDDGSFTIVPDANFNGDIDLTFDINDGMGHISRRYDLTVNPVNDLPQPQDQTFSITKTAP